MTDMQESEQTPKTLSTDINSASVQVLDLASKDIKASKWLCIPRLKEKLV